jgi:hypothetical protein
LVLTKQCCDFRQHYLHGLTIFCHDRSRLSFRPKRN